MAYLNMNETAAKTLYAGNLALSNQSLDPVRLNRSNSIYARQGCPEEGAVTISLCLAGSVGPHPEEPSMFMFFYPILAAYIFYAMAELCFRRYQKVVPLPGLLTDCRRKQAQPTPAVAKRRNTNLGELRRQSEGEVMLPQDPLATLKRDQVWAPDAVLVYQDSPERPFTIHPPNDL